MSYVGEVKVEPRQHIVVSPLVAAALNKVVSDWTEKNIRAPSALESNLIRERLDKALEPLNFLRDPNQHVKAWVHVEEREMFIHFTVRAKRVALIDEGDKPS